MLKKLKKLKFVKKLSMSLLTLAMMVGMVSISPVYAEDYEVDTSKTYAIVDTKTNLAINAQDTDNAKVLVNAEVKDSLTSKSALFNIVDYANEATNGRYNLVSLKYSGKVLSTTNNTNVTCQQGKDKGGWETLDLVKVDDSTFKIYSPFHQGYYYITDNKEINLTSNIDDADVFRFVEATYEDTESITIESVGANGYITFADQTDKGVIKVTENTDTVSDFERFNPVFKDGKVTLQSKGMTGYSIVSAYWNNGQLDGPFGSQTANTGGWESVIIEPNGDETVSLKSSCAEKYIIVNDNNELEFTTNSKNDLGDKGKFIVHTITAPNDPTKLEVVEDSLEGTQVSITWTDDKASIVSGYEIQRKGGTDATFKTIATVDSTTYTDKDLSLGTAYTYRVRAIIGKGTEKLVSDYTSELNLTTLNGVRPTAPTNIVISQKDDTTLKLTWDAVDGATKYYIYEAPSAYGEYQKVAEVEGTTYEAAFTTATKYAKYYRVAAANEYGASAITGDRLGLETKLFGKNTLVFAETDDDKTVDKILADLFEQQNDASKDAQFKADHYQVYFKPGDYTETSCMYLGFYTSFNGLGKTPYDVQLNNIAIPAYLSDNNATCNFWRSAENFSIINTGNAQGKAGYGSWRADQFNWAVAQAAPLRRIYSERTVHYDWQYGWASGGYVADSYFKSNDDDGNAAGTWSGQQFYTRNSVLEGNGFGTTLNNFYLGVKAPNLPTTDTDGWEKLQGVEGYSNWSILNDDGSQQVVTTINKTAQSQEKPFLFLDNGEYKVFVPALRENTSGTSWSENDMGEGQVLSLDSFYIAKPTDTAATINEQLAAGKNIYLTPGVYHAEEPIKVTNPNTIVLGTGMATIVADNSEAAMEVADVDGAIISGIIFDAGANSKYLLKVGEEGTHTSHASNPTLLQDLFFRIGGTTSSVTSADIALEVNSDDVLCDHFWIWRADHGAGVTWNSNPATNGLIVNGDNVSCYALFNEHFEEYDTLWNGENGSTYFYQNEKCYDPMNQEDWMTHFDTTNGYSAYKVSNKVNNHYAIGLGMYNVFINTGEDRDGMVPIIMDNAIEVPNKSGVMVENACIQTFANENAALQKFEHIINGVGEGVSSGIDKVNNVKGEGWSRKFLVLYNNGTAVLSDGTVAGKTARILTLNDVEQPMNEIGDVDVSQLVALYNKVKDYKEDNYTPESWQVFKKALDIAKKQVTNPYPLQDGETDPKTCIELWGTQDDADAAYVALKRATDQLKIAIDTSKLQALYNQNKDKGQSKYTSDSWKVFDKALKEASDVLANQDASQEDVDNAYQTLSNAVKQLKLKTSQPIIDTGDKNSNQNSGQSSDKVNTNDAMMFAPYAILAVCAAGAYVTIKRKRV